MADDIQVACPNCRNRRLFDIEPTAEGIVKIKCPKCNQISVINLGHVTEKKRRSRLKAYRKEIEKWNTEQVHNIEAYSN